MLLKIKIPFEIGFVTNIIYLDSYSVLFLNVNDLVVFHTHLASRNVCFSVFNILSYMCN